MENSEQKGNWEESIRNLQIESMVFGGVEESLIVLSPQRLE